MTIQIAAAKREKARLSPAAWRWIVIAMMATADAVLLARTGTRVSGALLTNYAEALVPWSALTFFYTWLRDNPRLATMTQIVLQACAFALSAQLLSYLVLTFRFPLMDQQFAALDTMLGLDWLAWLRWVESHPWLAVALFYAYGTIPIQFCVMVGLLPWVGRQRYLSEFCTAAAFALLIIIPISGITPALGPSVQFDIGVPSWAPDVLAMRSGSMTVLGEHGLQGVVEFPSFHTVLAILLVYAMSWNRWTLAASAVLNGLVLLSVPSVGSHYFVDMIAGVLVTLLAIVVARSIEGAGRYARFVPPLSL